jgi:hypothetical protein
MLKTICGGESFVKRNFCVFYRLNLHAEFISSIECVYLRVNFSDDIRNFVSNSELIRDDKLIVINFKLSKKFTTLNCFQLELKAFLLHLFQLTCHHISPTVLKTSSRKSIKKKNGEQEGRIFHKALKQFYCFLFFSDDDLSYSALPSTNPNENTFRYNKHLIKGEVKFQKQNSRKNVV